MNLAEEDLLARETALNPRLSFIVQAPAGSGKTELLIQRFLILLAEVDLPSEVFAITFTKKAASEMRERIISTLKASLEVVENLSPHKQKTRNLALAVLARDELLNWQLLKNPNQLKVQTIDSFCSYLSKNLPLSSGFGTPPAILENAMPLYEQAVLDVLDHLTDEVYEKDLRFLLLHLDNNIAKFSHLLCDLLSKRDQWLPYLAEAQTSQEKRLILETHLQHVVTELLTNVFNVFPKILWQELLSILYYSADHLRNAELQAIITDVNKNTLKDKIILWKSIAELLLTKSLTFRKRADKSIGFPALSGLKNAQEKFHHAGFQLRFKEMLAALYDNTELQAKLAEVMVAPLPHYSDLEWQTLEALLNILSLLTTKLHQLFKQHSKIDFIENAQATLFSLNNKDNPKHVSYALGHVIKHFLIDEFQDTSYTQYQLLEKLTWHWQENDGKTLFIVGDPMQSIYRFRQAEVGIFIRMFQGRFNQIKLTPLVLSTNFRSTATIVNWNNQLFNYLFPKYNDIASGAVTYSQSLANQNKQNHESHVKWQAYISGEGLGIAKTIKTLLAKHPDETITILVRARSHLLDIIPYLKQENIAYSAMDIDPLASKQNIQDLVSLTLALHDPLDKISWLAIFRAPFIGFKLDDLLVLAGDKTSLSIFSQANNQNVISRLSADARLRLDRVMPILEQRIANRGRYDLRDFIESTWQVLGGPAALTSEDELKDVSRFFVLLEKIEREEFSVSHEILLKHLNRLFAQTFADAKVKLMTIHNSKGLEFDTVWIPHLEKKNPHEDKSLLSWLEQPLANNESALLLAPLHAIGADKEVLYEYIYEQHKKKSFHEMDRLLYVATTRAVKRLYLSFTIKQKEDKTYDPGHSNFLSKLMPSIEKIIPEILQENSEEQVQSVSQVKILQRITSDSQNFVSDPLPVLFAKPYASVFHLSLKDNSHTLLGTVTHMLLEAITKYGLDWWEDNYSEHYLIAKLKLLGYPHARLAQGAAHIHMMIEKMLKDEKGQWILKPHQDAASELPLTINLQGQVIRLVIDRTFIDDEGTRWIIDYKTSEYVGDDLNLFLQTEKATYKEKMRLYKKAFQFKENRKVKLGLYFLNIPAWIEW